jgi:hypothetical protein
MINLVDIASAFSFIVSKGFVSSSGDYRPQDFGNARLVMTGAPFALQFQRDCGQVFVDIGSDVAGWYKLEYVLEFVDRSITQKQLGEPPDTALQANLLESHWDKVANAINDPQTRLDIEAFSKAKTANFIGGIFGKS